MANSKIKLNGKTVNWSGKASSSNSSNSGRTMQKTVDNYKTRINATGLDADELTDKRNVIEKALNLKEDQNALFDIFEVLNRPQNALFTGIDSALNGGSFLEGASEGIKGNIDTTGKDLLVNHAGMSDREGKLDMADVLGFGLDVVADPLDWALIPTTAGGSLAFKSGTDVIADATKAGIKGVTKGADNVVRAGLKTADKITDSRIAKLAAKNGMSEDTFKAIYDITGGESLKTYDNFMKKLKDTIDSNNALGGLVGKARNVEGNINTAKTIQGYALDDIQNQIEEYAQKIYKGAYDKAIESGSEEAQAIEMAKNAYEKFTSRVNDDLLDVIEYDRDYSISGSNWLKSLGTKSDNTFIGNDESVEALKGVLDKHNIKYEPLIDNNEEIGLKVTQSKIGTKKNNPKLIKDIEDLDLKQRTYYTQEQIERLDNALNDFNSDDYKEFYEARKQDTQHLAEIIRDYSGVDLTDITAREGYLRRAREAGISEDLANRAINVTNGVEYAAGKGKGTMNTSTFTSRKYNSALEGENLKQAEIESAMKAGQNKIEILESKKVSGQIDSLKEQRAKIYKQRKEKIKKLDKAFGKKKDMLDKHLANIDRLDAANKQVTELFTNKVVDKVSYLAETQPELANKITSSVDEYRKINDKVATLLGKIEDGNLTEAQLEKVATQFERQALKSQEQMAVIKKNVALAEGSIDKTTQDILDSATKSINKSNKLALKSQKANEKTIKLQDDLVKISQAQFDTLEGLQRKLDDISFDIAAYKNTDAAFDEAIDKEIMDIKNSLDILNSQKGKEIFNHQYTSSLDAFINASSEYTKGAKVYNEAVVAGTLLNPDYVYTVSNTVKEADRKIPDNFVRVNAKTISDQLSFAEGVLPEQSDKIKRILSSFENKDIYMDRDLARLLNLQKTSKEGANSLIKVIDSINNVFKKISVLSPGFQLRNNAGNLINMYLSGFPIHKVPKYWDEAAKMANSSEEILRKVATGVELTGEESRYFNILSQFFDAGFGDAGTRVQNLEDIKNAVENGTGVLNKALKLNMDLNSRADTHYRLMMLAYANDNPKFVQKLGKTNPIDAVRYALMDPNNMSDFEKNVVKKFTPFYTFTKENLYYQATNVLKNTPKYRHLFKAINDMYNDLDEDQYYQYQKEGMQIPIPYLNDDEGNQMFLKTNLPVSDLGEWMSNPAQRLASSSNPIIKTVAEMATGKDLYTGQDLNHNQINKFAEALGLSNMPEEVQNTTQLAEHILSGLGLSNISVNMIRKVTKILNKYNDSDSVDNYDLWAEIFRSVVQNTNQEKVENSKLYDEYEDYQNLMKDLKNQGIDVPTIKQISTSGKLNVNKLKNKRANSR